MYTTHIKHGFQAHVCNAGTVEGQINKKEQCSLCGWTGNLHLPSGKELMWLFLQQPNVSQEKWDK